MCSKPYALKSKNTIAVVSSKDKKSVQSERGDGRCQSLAPVSHSTFLPPSSALSPRPPVWDVV